ncbi:MAG: hypothetical protein WCX64_06750 [Candidatus Micrarchaeia archaeon]|jgi:hypothetical protein
MIFFSKDEDGVSACEKILCGEKTVTRRQKPLTVGKEFAVQSGRGKKAVCRAVVVACVPHNSWYASQISPLEGTPRWKDAMLAEARAEGFESVDGWLDWYPRHKLDVNETYRIEFRKKSC